MKESKPYRFQRKDIDRVWNRFGGRALVAWEMGLGKAQPLDAKVLTPDGWVLMEHVHVGDEVIGGDGRPTRVVGVFPQGIKKVYRLTTRDGASTECCGEHLWQLQTTNDRFAGRPGKVLALNEFRRDLTQPNGNARYYLPMVGQVRMNSPGKWPVHPYLLGYLLANGCFVDGVPSVSIPDKETVARLKALLPAGVRMHYDGGIGYRITAVEGTRTGYNRNPLTKSLRQLGLMGHKFDKKFIPREYLHADIDVREMVLNGLMDGDGSVTTGDNHLEYSTGSKRLARGVVFLVRSFGGTARVVVRDNPKFTYRGETRTGAPSHRISISLPNDAHPFLLSRKAAVYHPRTKYPPSRAVTGVKFVGRKECKCIKVENPDGLYVTDDFIVTHNTPAALWGWKWNNDHPGPLVIICPAYLKLNWEREVKLYLKMRAVVLDGETPPLFPPRSRVYIINYDILTPKKRKRRRGINTNRSWLKVLRSLRPSCLVVDESQYLKEMRAKRTKDVKKLQKGVPHFLALSGTGCIENCPAELWPVLNMIRPKRFATFYPFGVRYCQPRKTPWGMQYKGATKTKELNRLLLRTVMVRRQAADVLKDLPPLRSDIVTVPLTNRKDYAQAEKDLIRWLSKWNLKAAKRAANAERLVRWAHLRKCIAEGKYAAVVEWVTDFLATGKKLLLFGFHTEFLTKIHRAFKGSLLVTGKTRPADRDHLFHRFNSDPAVNLLVGNIDAAGTGWSCRATGTVAFCELVWNPAKHRQAAKRVHGINRGVKGEPARTVYLLADDTVEEQMAAGLQRKQKIQDQVLDGKKAGTDMDLMTMLEQKLLRKGGR